MCQIYLPTLKSSTSMCSNSRVGPMLITFGFVIFFKYYRYWSAAGVSVSANLVSICVCVMDSTKPLEHIIVWIFHGHPDFKDFYEFAISNPYLPTLPIQLVFAPAIFTRISSGDDVSHNTPDTPFP